MPCWAAAAACRCRHGPPPRRPNGRPNCRPKGRCSACSWRCNWVNACPTPAPPAGRDRRRDRRKGGLKARRKCRPRWHRSPPGRCWRWPPMSKHWTCPHWPPACRRHSCQAVPRWPIRALLRRLTAATGCWRLTSSSSTPAPARGTLACCRCAAWTCGCRAARRSPARWSSTDCKRSWKARARRGF